MPGKQKTAVRTYGKNRYRQDAVQGKGRQVKSNDVFDISDKSGVFSSDESHDQSSKSVKHKQHSFSRAELSRCNTSNDSQDTSSSGSSVGLFGSDKAKKMVSKRINVLSDSTNTNHDPHQTVKLPYRRRNTRQRARGQKEKTGKENCPHRNGSKEMPDFSAEEKYNLLILTESPVVCAAGTPNFIGETGIRNEIMNALTSTPQAVEGVSPRINLLPCMQQDGGNSPLLSPADCSTPRTGFQLRSGMYVGQTTSKKKPQSVRHDNKNNISLCVNNYGDTEMDSLSICARDFDKLHVSAMSSITGSPLHPVPIYDSSICSMACSPDLPLRPNMSNTSGMVTSRLTAMDMSCDLSVSLPHAQSLQPDLSDVDKSNTSPVLCDQLRHAINHTVNTTRRHRKKDHNINGGVNSLSNQQPTYPTEPDVDLSRSLFDGSHHSFHSNRSRFSNHSGSAASCVSCQNGGAAKGSSSDTEYDFHSAHSRLSCHSSSHSINSIHSTGTGHSTTGTDERGDADYLVESVLEDEITEPEFEEEEFEDELSDILEDEEETENTEMLDESEEESRENTDTSRYMLASDPNADWQESTNSQNISVSHNSTTDSLSVESDSESSESHPNSTVNSTNSNQSSSCTSSDDTIDFSFKRYGMKKLPEMPCVTPHKVSCARNMLHTQISEVCRSPVVLLTPVRLTSGRILSARDKVLYQCQQTEPCSFTDCIPPRIMNGCVKIGEGVYGEVFRAVRDRQNVALKIIPIEGDLTVNDEKQKTFSEILPEIVISKELSNLRDDKKHHTKNFVHVKDVSLVEGEYHVELLKQWDYYNKRKGSENDRPDQFNDQQLFLVFEFEECGSDLESFKFINYTESLSVLKQVIISMAVAECALKFEHRDLHWGNVLVKRYDDTMEDHTYRIGENQISIENCGVHAAVIDFTLSRLTQDKCDVFTDLSTDETLFQGHGDYQFDVYRLMQEENNNDWSSFCPYTNILWLHYTADKLLNAKTYPKGSNDKQNQTARRQLSSFIRTATQYQSAFHLVSEHPLFN